MEAAGIVRECPLLCTASRQSLAMLEMLVQDEPLRARYLMIEARIPKAVTIERVRIDDLPSNWRDVAARETLQAIGTEWARKQTSAVLAVPSAVIPRCNELSPQSAACRASSDQDWHSASVRNGPPADHALSLMRVLEAAQAIRICRLALQRLTLPHFLPRPKAAP